MRQVIAGLAVLLTIASHVMSAEPPKDFTNSIGMKFKLIPAGEFMMGSSESPEDLAKAFPNVPPNWLRLDRPQHKVRITKPFYLGVTEVTQKQYEKVMGGNPSYSPDRGLNTSNFPVKKVSWDDTVEFCKKLSAKEGQTYRLPTEAEWEYACRAGSKTRYCFGDDESLLGEYAWFGEQLPEDGSHPVGEKKPNAWGLYDMHGNIWEWCSDWFGENYYDRSPRDDPTGPATGSPRVFRGGSWYDDAGVCRSSFRNMDAPAYLGRNLGFRVALDVAERVESPKEGK